MDDFWPRFRLDPRDPANAALRASDADREVVRSVLAEAYADGRLTREEHDERVDATLGARTLGDLPALVRDLVPTTELAVRPAGALAPVEIRARAEAAYRKELRDNLFGFVMPTVICWVIWSVTMLGGFPWPLFVMLSGLGVVHTLVSRDEIIAKNVAKLERKQARRLKPGHLDPGDPEELE